MNDKTNPVIREIREKMAFIFKDKRNRMILYALAGLVAVLFFSTFLPRLGRIYGSIKVSGNVEATEVHVAFRIPGKIKEILVDEGYSVKKGDVLARLDTDELIRVKDEAAASLKTAEYEYLLAEDDFKRAQNLYDAGSFSTQKRDEAKAKADSLRSRVEQLRASLDLAETRLGFTELVSPIDGFVHVKSAESGEVVQAGSTVLIVTDLNDVWITAYINETSLGKVRLNQEVKVRTDSYPNRTFKGRISFISQEAEFTPKHIQTTEERVKLVYRIKISLDNKDMMFKPGMPADGYIKR